MLWGHILPYPKDGLVQPTGPTYCAFEKRQYMEMDTGIPGGIQQNQEYTDVRSVSRAPQSRIKHYSGQ